MKGSIAISLQKLVETKFGEDKWKAVLSKTGLEKNTMIYSHHDIDDEVVIKLIDNTCEVLGITLRQAADAFGEYWINEYAPKYYFAFFSGDKTAKEFILNMNRVHAKLTEKIENAKPPTFIFDEVDDKSIIMTYKSHRNLEELWIGLIKGVGIYFNEKIAINRLEKNKVKLTFA